MRPLPILLAAVLCACSASNADNDSGPTDASSDAIYMIEGNVPDAGPPVPTPHIMMFAAATPMAPAAVHVRAVWGREDFPSDLASCNTLPPAPAPGDAGTAPSSQGKAIADCLQQVDDLASARNTADVARGTVITARYQWDFGDPSGAHNQLEGFNAAHVYDHPGSYTITLTVTNEDGVAATTTQTVAIVPDARTSLYVDAVQGLDTNSGTSQATPLRTVGGVAARLAALSKTNALGAGTWILFQRGQTFDLTWPLVLDGYPNTRVAAYGAATAAPVLLSHGTDIVTLVNGTTEDVIIDGITIDTAQGAGTPLGIVAFGQNIVVRNLTTLHMGHAVECNWQTRGLYVVDGQSPLAEGLEGYFVWIDGTDIAIVGNHVANSTVEHVLRSSSTATDRVLIAGNDLNRTPGVKVGTTINMRLYRYLYVTGNVLHQGVISLPGDWGWPIGDGYQLSQWGVIERNRVGAGITLAHSGTHLMVRNNILAPEAGGETNPRFQLLLANAPVSGCAHPYLEDVHILDNTILTQDTSGASFVEGGSVDPTRDPDPEPNTLELANNLFVGPNLSYGVGWSAGILWFHPTLAAFASHDGNVWPAGVIDTSELHYVGTTLDPADYITLGSWNASGGNDIQNQTVVDPQTFAPSASSAAAHAGSPRHGVLTDFSGKPRPLFGTWPAGAVQP